MSTHMSTPLNPLSPFPGYLFGRYTTDRALLLKRAYIQQKLLLEDQNPIEVIRNLSISVRNINNMTSNILMETVDMREVYDVIRCSGSDLDALPSFEEFRDDFGLKINKVLIVHLEGLVKCFDHVDRYLRNVSGVN